MNDHTPGVTKISHQVQYHGKCDGCGKPTTRSRTFTGETTPEKSSIMVWAELVAAADRHQPDFNHARCL